MASFPVGKATAAFVNATATAANTVALANFNLDFSLYKVVQPPKEFSDVGNALSPTRRQEAESGKVHKTARQLSALFEPLLPPILQLEKAYGLRASEISNASAAKEEDQKRDGVFAGRAGADGTSIWAAATSGGGAIKVHLLACMLARLWEGSEATSIWVEIVAERKREIVAAFETSGSIDYAAHQATLEDLERYRLAEWDASARAWLRTADLRKARQQTQLELVIRNLQILVNSKPVLYESVLQAWKVALTGMESLLQGSPQQVQSGELLLGLAAWHLYPDMVVLSSSTTVIEQKDPLFGGGVLTFGLSGNTSNAQSGVHWSLPLAYLRYYGDPVIRTRAMTEDGSRLTADDLCKAVLGCVLGGWGLDGEDTLAASQFIVDLSEKISEALFTDSRRSQAISKYHNSGLAILAEAASDLLSSQGAERRRWLQLISLGRKSIGFLGSPERSAFGLSRLRYYLELQTSPEERIAVLRHLAKNLNVKREDILISYTCHRLGTAQQLHEYATALPFPRESLKRTSHGAEKTAQGHCRWVVTHYKNLQKPTRKTQGVPTKTDRGDEEEEGEEEETEEEEEEDENNGGDTANEEEQHADIARTEPLEHEFQEELLVYMKTVGDHGEDVFAVEDEQIYRAVENDEQVVYWYQPNRSPQPIPLIDQVATLDDWMHHGRVEELNPETKFVMVYGNSQAAIFIASAQQFDPPLDPPQLLPHTVEMSRIHRYLHDQDLDSARLLRVCDKAFKSIQPDYLQSLQGFATAVQLYKLMPDASIDIRILERPLSKAPWVKTAIESRDKNSPSLLQTFSLSRKEAFSCIIMLESGLYNIDPHSLSNVMAVSSGDSIFVAAPLLCDPFEQPPEQEIRRVLGNIGRPGIALLVPPDAPRIIAPDKKNWKLMNFDDYDGGEQDCFSDTSLHLSFTGASFPIDVGLFGGQDTEVYMLETLVSVHERGQWTADLDVLKTMADKSLFRQRTGCLKHVKQAKGVKKAGNKSHILKSIQNWAEFLERPQARGIVQAYQNWQARLAVTSVSLAQNHITLVLPDDICWPCVYEKLDNFQAKVGGGCTIIY